MYPSIEGFIVIMRPLWCRFNSGTHNSPYFAFATTSYHDIHQNLTATSTLFPNTHMLHVHFRLQLKKKIHLNKLSEIRCSHQNCPQISGIQ